MDEAYLQTLLTSCLLAAFVLAAGCPGQQPSGDSPAGERAEQKQQDPVESAGESDAEQVASGFSERRRAWSSHPVLSSGDAGRHVSLAQLADRAVASYYDREKGALRFAVSNSDRPAARGDWKLHTVTDEGDSGEFAALAVRGDRPHIAYFRRETETVRLVRAEQRFPSGSGDWTGEKIASFRPAAQPDLLAPEDGLTLVAVTNELELNSYRSSGESWSSSTLSEIAQGARAGAGLVAGRPSVCLAEPDTLTVFRRSGGSWSSTEISAGIELSPGCEILDIGGRTAVLFLGTRSDPGLKLAVSPGGGISGEWTVRNVLPDIDRTGRLAAVSDGERIYAAFQSLEFFSLKLATGIVEGAWRTATVQERGGRLGDWLDLAVLGGRPAAVYRDEGDKSLRFARPQSGKSVTAGPWESYGVDVPVFSGQWVAATNAGGRPAAVARSDERLFYARANTSRPSGPGDWTTQEILTPGRTPGTPFGADLAEVSGRPAVSFISDGDRKLYLLRPGGSGGDGEWELREVDSDIEPGQTSLTGIDGRVAIAYTRAHRTHAHGPQPNRLHVALEPDGSGSEWRNFQITEEGSASLRPDSLQNAGGRTDLFFYQAVASAHAMDRARHSHPHEGEPAQTGEVETGLELATAESLEREEPWSRRELIGEGVSPLFTAASSSEARTLCFLGSEGGPRCGSTGAGSGGSAEWEFSPVQAPGARIEKLAAALSGDRLLLGVITSVDSEGSPLTPGLNLLHHPEPAFESIDSEAFGGLAALISGGEPALFYLRSNGGALRYARPDN